MWRAKVCVLEASACRDKDDLDQCRARISDLEHTKQLLEVERARASRQLQEQSERVKTHDTLQVSEQAHCAVFLIRNMYSSHISLQRFSFTVLHLIHSGLDLGL